MPKPPQHPWNSRTRSDLIIEVWEHLDCESVGAPELEQIQNALREHFGDGALDSPASIARTVADEGAVLRHPEVFACDLSWRRQNLTGTNFADGLSFSSLTDAFESLAKIERMRREFQASKDKKELGRLHDVVAVARQDALMNARSKILDEHRRNQAKEISEWLGVWLQSPELFLDWLELRRRSPGFRNSFEGHI